MQSVHHGIDPAYLADTVSAITDSPTRPGLRSARRIGYRDVVRPWASVHSPSLAHSNGTLFLQPSVTLLTAHVSENFSKHTSLIHYLSFSPYAFL